MRRTALLVLPALLALLPAAPSSAGTGVCVSGGGVTACPTAVSRCFAGDYITVNVVAAGQGTVSCGGASAGCYAFRVTCEATTRVLSAGVMTCSATGSAVATCTVTLASLQ